MIRTFANILWKRICSTLKQNYGRATLRCFELYIVIFSATSLGQVDLSTETDATETRSGWILQLSWQKGICKSWCARILFVKYILYFHWINVCYLHQIQWYTEFSNSVIYWILSVEYILLFSHSIKVCVFHQSQRDISSYQWNIFNIITVYELFVKT
jgi:hypothetical protein